MQSAGDSYLLHRQQAPQAWPFKTDLAAPAAEPSWIDCMTNEKKEELSSMPTLVYAKTRAWNARGPGGSPSAAMSCSTASVAAGSPSCAAAASRLWGF